MTENDLKQGVEKEKDPYGNFYLRMNEIADDIASGNFPDFQIIKIGGKLVKDIRPHTSARKIIDAILELPFANDVEALRILANYTETVVEKSEVLSRKKHPTQPVFSIELTNKAGFLNKLFEIKEPKINLSFSDRQPYEEKPEKSYSSTHWQNISEAHSPNGFARELVLYIQRHNTDLTAPIIIMEAVRSFEADLKAGTIPEK